MKDTGMAYPWHLEQLGIPLSIQPHNTTKD